MRSLSSMCLDTCCRENLISKTQPSISNWACVCSVGCASLLMICCGWLAGRLAGRPTGCLAACARARMRWGGCFAWAVWLVFRVPLPEFDMVPTASGEFYVTRACMPGLVNAFHGCVQLLGFPSKLALEVQKLM